MATKTWTSKADFDTGTLSNVVDYRNNDLQLKCIWSTSGNLNTARRELAGCGIQTAGLSFGGYTTIGASSRTEEYNGSSWCTAGNLNVARELLAGCGTQTSGLSFGGTEFAAAVTEEYNGVSWVVGGNLNTNIEGSAGAGTQTAGLCFGGFDGSNYVIFTEEYNGSSWCTANNLNIPRASLAGCGTQTAGLSFGGSIGASSVVTEKYNGILWIIGNNLNIARWALAGAGTQTAGLSFGGFSGETEEYNGTLWHTSTSLITYRYALGGCGTQTAGLSFGGLGTPGLSNKTEEYNPIGFGSWIVDFDAGVKVNWTELSWANIDGGSVKARVKTANTQANLDSATWYPIGGSGYYEIQPIDVECPDNRWYRLELILAAGSTPEIEQIQQSYNFLLTANGRIRPSISAIARIRPIVTANGRIQVKVTKNITTNAKIKFIGYEQYLCSRAKLTISRQMKTWAMLVKEATPPFERRADIPWNARITSKSYKVILNSIARVRKSIDPSNWHTYAHVIQLKAFVRESFARGKVYQVLKDKGFIRLRFITSTAAILHGDNTIESVARILNNYIIGNACIVPHSWK